MVDAEKHYVQQMEEIDSEIKEIQASSVKRNLGFAFISFKEKNCVAETLSEIEIVKQNLVKDPKSQKLGIGDWKIMSAYPPSDIIWADIHNIMIEDGFWKKLYIPAVCIIWSAISFLVLHILEVFSDRTEWVRYIVKYCSPLCLAILTLYLFPKIIFIMTQQESNFRKSIKEASFLRHHSFMLTFNFIMSPLLSAIITHWLFPEEKNYHEMTVIDKRRSEMLIVIQNAAPLYSRFFVQTIVLCFMYQLTLNYQKVVSCFEKVIKNNGKSHFDEWFHDLSFKISVILALFTAALFFSVSAPHITLIITVFLVIQFYIEKYNLMYIYPLEFESQVLSRKALIKNSFYAIILFQTGIIGLGLLGDNLISKRALVYILTFIITQLIVIITMFEYMRRPWEGMEIELEKALKLQHEKLLDDSISCMTMINQLKENEDYMATQNDISVSKLSEMQKSQDELQLLSVAHLQVQQQKQDILTDAFNNPREVYLDYEPWNEDTKKQNAESSKYESQIKEEDFLKSKTDLEAGADKIDGTISPRKIDLAFENCEDFDEQQEQNIQKKEEALIDQLNLTLIDEEIVRPELRKSTDAIVLVASPQHAQDPSLSS